MNDMTVYYAPKPVQTARLLIVDSRRVPVVVSLKGSMTLGRDYAEATTDIRVNSGIAGRRHGEFFFDAASDSYYYIDNNSTNGTYINGYKLPPFNERGTQPYRLSDGDVIRIDCSELNNPHPQAVLMVFSRSMKHNEKWETFKNISSHGTVTIGRGQQNTICLQDMMASREHALINATPQGLVIYDRGSQNKTVVNGAVLFNPRPLNNLDVIKIANTMLVVIGNDILYNNPGERSGTLSVYIAKKDVNFGRKTLIKDIRFEAEAGDFVLILGGSGAGKTTLVNAILGDGKAEGEVILDGQNLYQNFKTMKSQIGLVPQFVNLRVNDKVNQTLMDIAQIKLDSKYYSKEDMQKRIDDVMEKVGVKNLENHLIRQLSGGQKKKVSVAAQLVGFQKVFICDEPDSGLDAASRVQQMEILKEISNNGKIVMVISHEPDDAADPETNEILFTKVIVLAKSSRDNAGHLAFFGNPYDALKYFNVTKLQDIMKEINPPHEGGRGRADFYIDKYTAIKAGKWIE